MPGADADKLKKSFEDYKAFSARSHAGVHSTGTRNAAPPSAPQPGTSRRNGVIVKIRRRESSCRFGDSFR
jgi:hypothetical protein